MDFDEVEKLIINNEFYKSYLLKKKIIESHNLEGIEYLIKVLYSSDFGFLSDDDLKNYLLCNDDKIARVVLNNLKAIGLSYEHDSSCINDDFSKYLKGKKISIVGPSNRKAKESGLVIKFNNLNEKVTYCSNEFFSKNKQMILDLLNFGKMDFVVVNGNYKKAIHDVEDMDLRKKIIPISPFILHKASPPLACLRVVYDLLARGVSGKNMFVSNIDFYTRFPLHDSSYKTTMSCIDDYLQSLSKHDLITNYIITKAMVIKNEIQSDYYLTKLFELDIEQYSSVLESNFRKNYILSQC